MKVRTKKGLLCFNWVVNLGHVESYINFLKNFYVDIKVKTKKTKKVSIQSGVFVEETYV